MTQPTLKSVQSMTEEELAAVKRAAAINIAKFIGVKIGIAVAVHYSVKSLVRQLDDAS